MKKAAQPYLHFDGNCREAMQFYQQLFGGELYTLAVEESPMKNDFPVDVQTDVLHSTLTHEDFVIMASDMCGMGKVKKGNDVELSLSCSTEEEINQLYQELSRGGSILQKLQPQFWGALFAMVIDRFGVRWMLSLDTQND